MRYPTRWLLYLLSISPLLIFLGLYNLLWGDCLQLDCISDAAAESIFAILLAVIGSLGMLALGFFKKVYLETNAGDLKVVEISKNKDYEMLTFFFTYIIPLVAFGQEIADDKIKETIAFIIIMCALGYLYVRTDLYMSNPVLLYFNLHLFEVSLQGGENLTVLSRDTIISKDFIRLRYLSSTTAIAVKHKPDSK